MFSRRPDAIITDYNMGEMSGVALIQRLREAGVNIPIIMVSNHPLIRQQAVTAGATAFIDKIEIAERLVETVRGSLISSASSNSNTHEHWLPAAPGESVERIQQP